MYDRTRAYLPLEEGYPEAGALRVQDLGTVAAPADLFDLAWQRSTDLEPALVQEDTTQDRQILRALLENTTDQAAARQLNVSVRTFRRHVAQLMVRLDASTRFQLAALAKESAGCRSARVDHCVFHAADAGHFVAPATWLAR